MGLVIVPSLCITHLGAREVHLPPRRRTHAILGQAFVERLVHGMAITWERLHTKQLDHMHGHYAIAVTVHGAASVAWPPSVYSGREMDPTL